MNKENEYIRKIAIQVLHEIEKGYLRKFDPVSHCKAIEEMLIEAESRGFREALAEYGIILDDKKEDESE